MAGDRERPTRMTTNDFVNDVDPATEAKQDAGNTSLSNLDVNLGAKADSAAATDTGTYSLIALFKRLLSKLTSGLSVILSPATSGGFSPYRNLDLGVTGVNPKASAGQIFGWFFYNNASSARYIKFYDKATGPTESDTPVFTMPLPGGAAANALGETGIAFASGIGLRATTGVADADTGAPASNDVICNIFYK